MGEKEMRKMGIKVPDHEQYRFVQIYDYNGYRRQRLFLKKDICHANGWTTIAELQEAVKRYWDEQCKGYLAFEEIRASVIFQLEKEGFDRQHVTRHLGKVNMTSKSTYTSVLRATRRRLNKVFTV